MASMGPLLVLLFVALCGVPSESGPALLIEMVLLAAAAAWLSRVLAHLAATVRLSRSLQGRWEPASIQGIECRVITDPSAQAFVLGTILPRVYITEAVIAILDADAQRAVLLHEDHHRRSWAPLRTVLIDSWRDTIGRIPPVSDMLGRRLARLEQDADRHALAHGARRSDLARALLAVEGHVPGTAFTGHARLRIEALLEPQGSASTVARSVPVEWLGVGMVVAATLLCLS